VIAEDSLRRRYVSRLGGSVVGLPLTFLTQSIAPRLLGPALYGDFNFLTAFFMQVVAFCDSGLSSAFYSKFSQRTNEPGLLRFFWGVTATLSVLVVGGVVFVFVVGADRRLWPGQQAPMVWLAMGWGLLTWYGMVINKVTDAYGLTVPSELVRLLQKALGLTLITGIFLTGHVGLAGYFAYQYVVLAALCAGWWVVVRRGGRVLVPAEPLTPHQRAAYRTEFVVYASPLVAFQLLGLVTGVADRWLLQTFAGSVQQGFFGLSYQVGAMCFLVSGAMVPLFWREIAREHHNNNLDGMRHMFRRHVPLLYIAAAFLSVFVALQAEKVSLIVGGPSFQAAALPIAIMALYPIHQTYGQLNAAFLFATGHTREYRNVGFAGSTFQIAIAYWLIAPREWWGLGLGALGLALAMVVAQFVSVNLQLRFITRYLGISHTWLLVHQLSGIAALGFIGWGSVRVVDHFVPSMWLALVVSGIAYVTGAACLVWMWPQSISRTRADLRTDVRVVASAVRRLMGQVA
jgi:O-antigen/teichoic acid export membrane protein